MFKKISRETWGIVLLVLFIASFISFIIYGISKEKNQDAEKAYKVWSRVYPQYKLTLDEWKSLDRHNALPGQVK